MRAVCRKPWGRSFTYVSSCGSFSNIRTAMTLTFPVTTLRETARLRRNPAAR